MNVKVSRLLRSLWGIEAVVNTVRHCTQAFVPFEACAVRNGDSRNEIGALWCFRTSHDHNSHDSNNHFNAQ